LSVIEAVTFSLGQHGQYHLLCVHIITIATAAATDSSVLAH